MKVFICEDDTDILELMKIILRDLGDKKLVVESCGQAGKVLPSLKKSRPNLIIADYWLGDEKIDTVLKQVRKDPEFKRTPIILTSAVDNLETVAADLPVDKVIRKPLDIFDFQKQVSSMLKSLPTNESRRHHRRQPRAS